MRVTEKYIRRKYSQPEMRVALDALEQSVVPVPIQLSILVTFLERRLRLC